MSELKDKYGLQFTDDWQYFTAGQMGELKNAFNKVRDQVGGDANFKKLFGEGLKIRRYNHDNSKCGSDACGGSDEISLYNGFYSGKDNKFYNVLDTIAHELGHVWDFRNGQKYSAGMKDVTQGKWIARGCTGDDSINQCNYAYRPGPGVVPSGSYAYAAPAEDFATAFALWINGKDYIESYNTQQFEIRMIYIQRQLNTYLGSK
jgi:hypothetical protein